MIVDVLLIVSCFVFFLLAALGTYFIIWSRRVMRRMERKIDRAIRDVEAFSEEGRALIENIDDLTTDVKLKVRSLDFIFEPLSEINNEIKEQHSQKRSLGDLSDVLECVSSGLTIYQKIKGGFERYVKSK